MTLHSGCQSTLAMLSKYPALWHTNFYISVAILCLVMACTPDDTTQSSTVRGAPSTTYDEFWTTLQELCGQAFPGQLIEANPSDELLTNQVLIMHVRECQEDFVKIPFHVGNDHSRTWVISRQDDGLRLKHEHRHEDGTEDEITQYGGDTTSPGSHSRQDFPADAHTASLVPTATDNIWTLEVNSGRIFLYSLRNQITGRRVRLEFNLTKPIETLPPAPWGAS